MFWVYLALLFGCFNLYIFLRFLSIVENES
jgi:hypothetical protein